jgi:benzoylformate decarboxylase
MGQSERPVVAILGDGSTTFAVHALWSAAHYGVGLVAVVIGNSTYGAMDELARAKGAPGAWPSFESLDLATVATGLGCEARRIATYDELLEALDAVSAAGERTSPLLLDVRVAP